MHSRKGCTRCSSSQACIRMRSHQSGLVSQARKWCSAICSCSRNPTDSLELVLPMSHSRLSSKKSSCSLLKTVVHRMFSDYPPQRVWKLSERARGRCCAELRLRSDLAGKGSSAGPRASLLLETNQAQPPPCTGTVGWGRGSQSWPSPWLSARGSCCCPDK